MLSNLALDLNYEGRYVEAEEAASEAEDIFLHALDPSNWAVCLARVERGSALAGQGRHCRAEELWLSCWASLSEKLGPESRFAQSTARRLMKLYRLQGRDQEADRFGAVLLRP